MRNQEGPASTRRAWHAAGDTWRSLRARAARLADLGFLGVRRIGMGLIGVGLVATGLVATGLVGTGLTGCGPASGAASANDGADADDRPVIVTTTGMIGDLVSNLVARGDAAALAEVVVLMGPEVDPHSYQLTRADRAALERADAVVFNGFVLEGKITESLERMRRAGVAVLSVAELVRESQAERLLAWAEGDKPHDPHLWNDPLLWAAGVEATGAALADGLFADDAAAREAMAANAASYAAAVRGLDEYARETLGSVPEASRVLITAHDAFNYLGARYGLTVEGVQGISTESEAGVADLERLISLCVERRVPAVFVETTVSDRTVRALIDGASSRGHAVRLGGSLFSDAMGPAGTYEGTYIGMFDHNVTTIARGLGGTAPVGGMQGRLAGAPDGDRVMDGQPVDSGTMDRQPAGGR